MSRFVYLVRCGEQCKIGTSGNVAKRIRSLAANAPAKIELIHYFEAEEAAIVEACWHQHFRAKRLKGEWFALEEADIQEFARVGAIVEPIPDRPQVMQGLSGTMAIEDVVREIGVGEAWIYKLIQEGRLRVSETGRGRGHHTLIFTADVMREKQRRAEFLQRRLRSIR